MLTIKIRINNYKNPNQAIVRLNSLTKSKLKFKFGTTAGQASF